MHVEEQFVISILFSEFAEFLAKPLRTTGFLDTMLTSHRKDGCFIRTDGVTNPLVRSQSSGRGKCEDTAKRK